MSNGHSNFSPSSAHRWVNCQVSLQEVPGLDYVMELEEGESEFARDGSAKHALGEWALSNNQNPVDALLMERAFHGVTVTTDMVEAADVYVDTVRELMKDETYNIMELESRVYVQEIHEDMYGTLDVRLFSEAKRHLIIGDAKFGWEIVEAAGNWQLRSYAIGAVRELEDQGYEIDTVTVFICQPADKEHPYKWTTYNRSELKGFAKTLRRATKGSTLKPGSWCRYCRRSTACTGPGSLDEYARGVLPYELHTPEDFDDLIARQTPEKVAEILDRQEVVKIWFAAAAAWAKQLMILGRDVPGYCLRDSQGNRDYRDINASERVLHAEYGDDIYEPRVLRSPAQIEKVFPGAKILLNGTDEFPGLTHRPQYGQKLKKRTD